MNCAKPLLELGIAAESLNLQSVPTTNATGSVLFGVDFKLLEGLTEFPYGLLIPQHITESAMARILQERAEKDNNGGIVFTRGMRMTGMKEVEKDTEHGRKKGFLVAFDNGREIWCQYLVGADGSKSTVRCPYFSLIYAALTCLLRSAHSHRSPLRTQTQNLLLLSLKGTFASQILTSRRI